MTGAGDIVSGPCSLESFLVVASRLSRFLIVSSILRWVAQAFKIPAGLRDSPQPL